jgi:hypothetical protein
MAIRFLVDGLSMELSVTPLVALGYGRSTACPREGRSRTTFNGLISRQILMSNVIQVSFFRQGDRPPTP